MTRILRDLVRRDVERALIRDAVGVAFGFVSVFGEGEGSVELNSENPVARILRG
jgi:hypothetical protein